MAHSSSACHLASRGGRSDTCSGLEGPRDRPMLSETSRMQKDRTPFTGGPWRGQITESEWPGEGRGSGCDGDRRPFGEVRKSRWDTGVPDAAELRLNRLKCGQGLGWVSRKVCFSTIKNGEALSGPSSLKQVQVYLSGRVTCTLPSL